MRTARRLGHLTAYVNGESVAKFLYHAAFSYNTMDGDIEQATKVES